MLAVISLSRSMSALLCPLLWSICGQGEGESAGLDMLIFLASLAICLLVVVDQ